MNKFIITFSLVLSALYNYGQDSEHITFKGVPIDGTISQYVNNMKLNGLTLIQTKDETAVLNGDFAGYKNCIIKVSTLKQKDLVHKITVVFPGKNTWSTLLENYLDLKNMLKEKYGETSEVVEKFEGHESNYDSDKILDVQIDRCKYKSNWKTSKGEIQLSIDHNNSNCFISLVYIDKINSEKIKANAKGDL